MNRGNWEPPLERIDASWAVAKLAGYAALLREAFATTNGADLVRLILEGRIGNNVFSLARALERGGLLNIGNGQDYASNAIENDEGVAVDTALAGWTARALAGPGAAVPVARATEPGGLGLAAFATPDTGSGAANRITGISASWRNLSWGVLLERDGFLGRPATALLGARRGRWTWLGWSGSKRIGPWRLAAGIEAAAGTADASRSSVVADYGSIITSAWRAEASHEGDGSSASLIVQQPPRTERARIRLRHGEGVVRQRSGREIRITAQLIRAGGWNLAFTHVRHPGHDPERREETRVQAGWRIGW